MSSQDASLEVRGGAARASGRPRLRRRLFAAGASVCLALLQVGSAWGQVAIPTTRVVFPAAQKSVSVPIHNLGGFPVLVQSWISDGDPDQSPEASTAPFVLAPPMVRLEPGQSKYIRVQQLAAQAPSDEVEHLYWLNVLALAPKQHHADQGQLELSVRSRYKLLFRPAGLSSRPVNQAVSVTWSVDRVDGARVLVARNASAYVLNLGSVDIVSGRNRSALDNPHVLPHSTSSIVLPDDIDASGAILEFTWIDDEGRLHPARHLLP
ncbi:fimbrial biogenesis chaperone [Stenotrophomonas maltophilia]|uniref:fimbrial biogenesis chaperone n=1 Tax=Stenotrophomonas maltophilia TaxID=40324 RepID=UPI0009BD5555|nr:molecular chaperone [Stenotrophomonas maltophilia]